ncbi:pilin [Patescibacteria group bacterium]|nr:pilin [Patescibacteria group bacterium]
MKKNNLRIYNLTILIFLLGCFFSPFLTQAEIEGEYDVNISDYTYESEVDGDEVINTINTNNANTSNVDNISDGGQITYELLEQSLPGIPNKTNSLGEYLGGIFTLAIGIASALAVLMIVIGGFKYMTSEAVSYKTAAMQQIQDAILGLIMVLASYLILNTINEDLVGFNLNLKPVEIQKEKEPEKPKEEQKKTCYCNWNEEGITSTTKLCFKKDTSGFKKTEVPLSTNCI